MTVQIGRLILPNSNSQWPEPVGDPITSTGGSVVPSQRSPYQVQIAMATQGQGVTTAQANIYRRQIRSMLNNTLLKNLGGLYVIYSLDSEQNGWYVPDAGNLTPIDEQGWQAVGLWQLTGVNWDLTGRRRTFREARSVWMYDLRTGNFERDYLQLLLSTDFAALPALQLTPLPNGASSVANAVNGQSVATVAMPTGRDGGVTQLVAGQANLAALSYERTEAQMNLSDVIVYDRMGTITAPTTGADASWSEVYGPDWPYNWQTQGQPNDTPVLDNGLVRVRYDASVGVPGFRVDVWTGSAYSEQGKMCFRRNGDSLNNLDTFVSSSLQEYTTDRAVVKCVLAASADTLSRELIYITVQRGELGVTFEYYPAPKAAGTAADCRLLWTSALNSGVGDLNNSVVKIDSQGATPLPSWTAGAAGTAAYAATAGTGAGTGNSGQFGSSFTTLGNANFTTSENWVSILRCPTVFGTVAAYQTTLVIQQAANVFFQYAGSNAVAYGTNSDTYWMQSQNTAGYLQVQVGFSATTSDQINEAENIKSASVTVSNFTDATASGGTSAKDTQTSSTNATLLKNSTNLLLAQYRVFIRAKVDSGATGSFAAALGTAGVFGSTVTSTSTTYVWLDLGDITCNVAGGVIEVVGWRSAGGAGSVYIDRVELVLTQDRTRTSAIYSGGRDMAQAALMDSRTLGTLVAR